MCDNSIKTFPNYYFRMVMNFGKFLTNVAINAKYNRFPTKHFCYFSLVIYINADFDHFEEIIKPVNKKLKLIKFCTTFKFLSLFEKLSPPYLLNESFQ